MIQCDIEENTFENRQIRKKAVMDLAVAWYQEEQEGEAKRIWSNIWETAEMVRKNTFPYV